MEMSWPPGLSTSRDFSSVAASRVAQMLVNILDRLKPEVVLGVTALGLHLAPMPAWDWKHGLIFKCAGETQKAW